jgi:hypothetical protein
MELFTEYLIGFAVNFAVALIIVRFIYYPMKQSRKYVFTFLAFNTVIYFVMGLMGSIELSVGAGFGLFAIFSVLRYRTDPIPIREMTYLFVLIALPVMNSLLVVSGGYTEMALANGIIIAVLYLLEREVGFDYQRSKTVTYERIELIKPENYDLLLDDLIERTGIDIIRCEIGRIDFLRDVAEVKIYYNANLLPGINTPSEATEWANQV